MIKKSSFDINLIPYGYYCPLTAGFFEDKGFIYTIKDYNLPN